MNSNRVAVSLAAEDTGSCLRELDRLAPRIGLAEVRLDLMRTFDISKLVAKLVCGRPTSSGSLAMPAAMRRAKGKAPAGWSWTIPVHE